MNTQTTSANDESTLDPKLLADGIAQLVNEIEVINNWLHELDNSDPPDPDAEQTRASYRDMLHNRREMLNALRSQSLKDL